jgi:hypothetical protein
VTGVQTCALPILFPNRLLAPKKHPHQNETKPDSAISEWTTG